MSADKRYSAAFRKRFPEREELAATEALRVFSSTPGVTVDGAKSLLDLIHEEFQIPIGLIRPEDTWLSVASPLELGGWFAWMESQVRAGDAQAGLLEEVSRHLAELGVAADDIVLDTLYDLARLWSGAPVRRSDS